MLIFVSLCYEQNGCTKAALTPKLQSTSHGQKNHKKANVYGKQAYGKQACSYLINTNFAGANCTKTANETMLNKYQEQKPVRRSNFPIFAAPPNK